VHAYVIDCWIRLPILVFVERVIDGLSFNNLTKVIMVALLMGGGLMKEDLSKKFLCFVAYGVNNKLQPLEMLNYSFISKF
jgi:hypothetical protein